MGQAIVTVFDHLSRIFQIMRHHKAPTEQILLLPCGQETPFRHTCPVAPPENSAIFPYCIHSMFDQEES